MNKWYEPKRYAAHLHPMWTPPGIKYAPADPNKQSTMHSYYAELPPPEPEKKSS
jgi:hypothetical protein